MTATRPGSARSGGVSGSQPPGSRNTTTSPCSIGMSFGSSWLTMIRSLMRSVSSIDAGRDVERADQERLDEERDQQGSQEDQQHIPQEVLPATLLPLSLAVSPGQERAAALSFVNVPLESSRKCRPHPLGRDHTRAELSAGFPSSTGRTTSSRSRIASMYAATSGSRTASSGATSQ